MSLLWIIALIIVLYAKTWNYRYVIDDYVERDGYLYDIPRGGPSPQFWTWGPSPWYRLFMIGMHCVNVSIIYMLWGWAPALLFAVHPMAAWGTCWVTGNYYATTAYFCLISYFILHTFPNVWGTLVALGIFTAALNSTICAVGFPFFLLAIGNVWGLAFLFPLGMFLNGKRFKTGMKIRTHFQKHCSIKAKFTPRRLVLVTKLMARYLYSAIVPNRLGMFSSYGMRLHDHPDEYRKMQSINGEFWSSLLLCTTLFGLGLLINPVATLWFFLFMGVHSQINLMGQFYAQRYIYLPMVGLCVVAGTVLQHYPVALTAVVTFYIIRTYLFIPAWKNQEALYRHDMDEYPNNAHTYNNMINFILSKNDGMFANDHDMYEAGYMMNRALALAPEDHEIRMNVVAYYNATGKIGLCLYHTEKAIEFCKRIHEEHPMVEKLEGQRDRIKARIDKLEKEGKLTKGALGNQSLSHPKKDQGGRDGTGKNSSKEEGKGIECNRSTEHQGRETRVAECIV